MTLVAPPPQPFVNFQGSPFVRRASPLTNVPTAGSQATGSAIASDMPMTSEAVGRSPLDSRKQPLSLPSRAGQASWPRVSHETDVSLAARAQRGDDVKCKFDDILTVSDSCHTFGEHDIENARDDFSVAGRWSNPDFIRFFESLGASNFILNTLKYGHKPSLIASVPDYERDNNKSFSVEHIEFGMGEIKKLIDSRKVEIVSHKPKIVNPLSVAVHPRLRLILDCSFLNRHITVPSFKMEDKTARSLFDTNGYLFSFDLKDGYHHILIHPEFRDYLGFKFQLNGQTVYARYVVAPFGLRDIPFLFTKILRPLVAHWRRCNIKICIYLDDGFSSADTYAKAMEDSIHIRQDLMRAGAVWNVKKSTWNPARSIDWVGFLWDTVSGTMKIREKRVTKLKTALPPLLALSVLSTRKLAGMVGQIVSMQPVLGDITRLKTRNCLIAIARALSWDEKITLDAKMKEEFKFWLENIDRLNVLDCFPGSSPVVFNLTESDASSTGCGSILNKSLIAARMFEETEREQSSTHREISNILFSLASFLPHFEGKSVTLKTDSQSAARICKIGSMNPNLHSFAEAIFELCFKNKIDLVVDWIPRELNTDADLVSRLADRVDIDDWQISPEFFSLLDNRWGPLTVDLFANYYNAKCEKFFSLFHSPRSHGVDAFRYDWSKENALMVPPIPLIPSALAHARLCRCQGVLVVPFWTSANFWPVLAGEYRSYVKDFLRVKGSKILMQGRNTKCIFGSKNFQGDMLALKLDFL